MYGLLKFFVFFYIYCYLRKFVYVNYLRTIL